jgi:4-amino-4-deoxy-L-arabinose transferase-like glycosyltransferase
MVASVPSAAVSRRRGRPALLSPLAALLILVAVVGLLWALLVPPWQSPDETWHFAYSQSLAERFALPGDTTRLPYSTDESLALNAVGANQLAFSPLQLRPDWSALDARAYQRAAARGPSRTDGGGGNLATANPPLFYLYDDIPYWAASAGTATARLYAMRAWNVTLLLASVLGAWLLAGELFARRRLAQLVTAATVGLVPMQDFMLTNVNPDAMLVALWAFALWLGARVIRTGGRGADPIVLCGLTAAAILTKATSYALVPPVAVALLLAWLRRPPGDGPSLVRRLAVGLVVLVGPILGWVALASSTSRPVVNAIRPPAGHVAHPFKVTGFLSYLWQFYLPRLPFLTRFKTTPGLPVYETWLKGGWGVFGWQDVWLPLWAYRIVAVACAATALGALALISRLRHRLALSQLLFLAVALLSLLGLLHISDYRSIIAGDGQLLQGRYLLPVSALLGLALGLLATGLTPRWRGAFCGAVVGGLLVLQVLALGTLTTAYYT